MHMHTSIERASYSTGRRPEEIDDRKRLHQKRDRLKQLRAFCHTARLGSISRAAEYVGSSQPAVSQQMRALEEEFGVALFGRRGPRISLAHAGECLYEQAMPLVERMDRLPDTFAEQHHGIIPDRLRIGAGQSSAAYVLPDYLRRFRERHPEVRVSVKTGSGRQRLTWLLEYEVDIVVGAMDAAQPDVDFLPFLDSECVLITPEDHPLAGRASVGFAELAAYPMVAPPPGRYARQATEQLVRLHGAVPDIAVEVDGWSVITNYVASGLGIAIVPDVCLTERERVCRIPFGDRIPVRRYGTATRRDGLVPLAASRLLDVIASAEAHGSP